MTTSPSRSASIAAIAALIATLGDLLLLYIGNSRRPELGLPPIHSTWLWVGGILGVIAIPFYALGYRAVSYVFEAISPRAVKVVFWNGVGVGVLGSLIHGVTALYIGLDQGAGGEDPLQAIFSTGFFLPGLWAVATIQVIIISALFLWYTGSGRTGLPRSMALINPAVLTILLVIIGLPSVFLRAFLIPAAPNIAHSIFFLLCSYVLRPLEA